MGYNKEFLTAALEEIKRSGSQKRAAYERQKQLLANERPRLKEIEQELMKIGPMLGISALGGYHERVNALRQKSEALAAEREQIYKEAGFAKYSPNCELCGDTGYIHTRLCSCVLKRAKEKSLEKLSGNMPIRQSRFDNFKLDFYKDGDRVVMEKIFVFCKNYAKNLNTHSQSVLFFGGTGLGKTHLSLAIAKTALEKGMGAVYSPTQNLVQKLEKEHFSYSSQTPLLDDVLSCDILIMDDLGAEFSNSYSMALIYNIINTRLLAEKPTIISTNLTIEEIAERYTPRVASRILGSYALKRFAGSDVRQQKRILEISGENKQ